LKLIYAAPKETCILPRSQGVYLKEIKDLKTQENDELAIAKEVAKSGSYQLTTT
jgi:hypothetical protein